MLSARQLAYAARGRSLLRDIDLDFAPGQVHAVLGPNGAGKSSLLRLLSGEWQPDSGEVRLQGRRLQDWPLPELARQRAVLPQLHALSFPYTAQEVVRLGRLHAGAPQDDAAVVDAALSACGLAGFAPRLYTQLSGGERARVQLARALAQIWHNDAHAGRYLLLDEPTAHLDLAHQHACLRLARDWARRGDGLILVLHDPNLALRYADTVTLLRDGTVHAQGTAEAVLRPDNMRAVFGLHTRLEQASDGSRWLSVTAPVEIV